MDVGTSFRRARRPEQIEQRRRVILDAAREAIGASRLDDISIRRIAELAGVSKTNVLHYFPSREAIFLDLLDALWGEWLDELDGEFPHDADLAAVAGVIARTVASRPELCELIAALNPVLERNIPLEVAVDFKTRAVDHHRKMTALLLDAHLFTPGQAELAAAGIVVLVTGLWPYCTPTAVISQACARVGLPDPSGNFAGLLAVALTAQLTGIAAVPSIGIGIRTGMVEDGM